MAEGGALEATFLLSCNSPPRPADRMWERRKSLETRRPGTQESREQGDRTALDPHGEEAH